MRHKTNMNNLKKDLSTFTSGGSKDWFSLQDGRNIIRILPPYSSEGKFFQQVGFHRIPGSLKDKVICPNFTFGHDNCPICKKSKQVYDKNGKDAARPYWPQKRAYLNVLDMKAADGIVRVLEVGSTVLNPILNFMAEENSDDLIDPEVGFNIMIRRFKEANFTKYETMIKPSAFSLAQNGYDVDTVLESLHDLGAMVAVPSAEDFYDILDGINSKSLEEETEAEQEEIPQANQQTRPGQRQAVQPSGQPKQSQARKPVDDGDDIPAGPGRQAAGQQAAKPGTKAPRPIQDDGDDLDNDPRPKSGDVDSIASDLDFNADFEVDDIPF